MEIRFYGNPDTGLPHIYGHGVTEDEAHQVLRRAKTMSEQKFPPGWDENRVREVIAHYESQSEDEQFAEIEAARESEEIVMMAVPAELAPTVRALIARQQHST